MPASFVAFYPLYSAPLIQPEVFQASWRHTGHDLPSSELLDLEVARWQRKFGALPAPDRPDNFASALSQCDSSSFPDIHILLRITYTISVTSCECERCCSVLRQLSSYMRFTMSQDRLSSYWLCSTSTTRKRLTCHI